MGRVAVLPAVASRLLGRHAARGTMQRRAAATARSKRFLRDGADNARARPTLLLLLLCCTGTRRRFQRAQVKLPARKQIPAQRYLVAAAHGQWASKHHCLHVCTCVLLALLLVLVLWFVLSHLVVVVVNA